MTDKLGRWKAFLGRVIASCWLLSCPRGAAQVTELDGVTYLIADSAGALISYAVPVAQPAFANPYLAFDIGFASNEMLTPAVFPDSLTLTLQNTPQTATSILLTTDVSGTLWSPGGEGTTGISMEDMRHEAAAWPGDAAEFSFSEAHQVAARIPLELLASPMSLYVDLFDNQNTIRSTAWIRGVTVLPGRPVQISGAVSYYAGGASISGVTVALSGDGEKSLSTPVDGRFQFITGASGTYSITPSRTSDTTPNRGVTTLDISLIRRHILGISPLGSPHKILAADVNGSSVVTTLDIVFIRNLILGRSATLPGGLWRFLPSDILFPDPASPWSSARNRSYQSVAIDTPGQGFFGIKMGDVNGSWTPEPTVLPPPEGTEATVQENLSLAALRSTMDSGRKEGPVIIRVESRSAPQGSLVKIPIVVSGFKEVLTAQFTLKWDPGVLQFQGTLNGGLPALETENLGSLRVSEGLLAFSWDDPTVLGVTLPDGSIFFELQFKVTGTPGQSSLVEFVDDPTAGEVSKQFEVIELVAASGEVLVEAPPSEPQLKLIPSIRGGWKLTIQGAPGSAVTLQVSTDLQHWTSLGSTLLTDGVAVIELTDVSRWNHRFYRLWNQP